MQRALVGIEPRALKKDLAVYSHIKSMECLNDTICGICNDSGWVDVIDSNAMFAALMQRIGAASGCCE